MTHQSTLDKLNKKTNESNENQEREACMTEILLDKVMKLEKSLKDLQLKDGGSCLKCRATEQERKIPEFETKDLNFKLAEMNRRQDEIQKDLLMLVENCADFETDLMMSKKQNELLSKQVKALLSERKDKCKESPSNKMSSQNPPRIITISGSPQAFQPSISAPVFHPAPIPQNFYFPGPEVWPELSYDATCEVGFHG